MFLIGEFGLKFEPFLQSQFFSIKLHVHYSGDQSNYHTCDNLTYKEMGAKIITPFLIPQFFSLSAYKNFKGV